MARRNFYNNNQSDVTRPPESFNDSESIIEGKTIPDESDPTRGGETIPEFGPGPQIPTWDERKDLGNRRPTVPATGDTVIADAVNLPSFEGNGQRNRRVVGWMVGIKGVCRGIDYRLHEGKNYIGRSTKCEVNVDDLKVSAGNVAQVVFDPRSKRFFSSDCDGTSTICYQNGEPLLGRNEIKIYDRIELGDSTLLFVPLCGEAFTWEDEDKEKEKASN